MTTDRHIQQARFWRKFMRLTRGRIDTFRAIDVILQEPLAPEFKETLEQIHYDLKSGMGLYDAFRKHPATFSLCVLELLASAESSGAWDEILAEIAGGLEDGTFD